MPVRESQIFLKQPTKILKVRYMSRGYVAVPIVLALVANGLVYGHPAALWVRPKNPRLPPGWVIGAVWVVLFGMLGHVAYLVRTHRGLHALVGIILAYCLAYPFATNVAPSLAGSLNAGALLLAVVLVCALAAQRRTRAVVWSVPLLAWCAYVNGE